MEFTFFEDLLTILGAALLVAIAFSRLKLPSIVAYMFAGTMIGPHVFGWIAEPQQFSLIAEFGVVFLLFALGLEFSLPRMWTLRTSVFGLGGAQVLVTTSLFAGVVYAWGASFEASVIIAGALALSSTAIVTRELGELQQFDSRYAQLSIAVLLFQDLIAVVFLILVPVLASSGDNALTTELGQALGKGIALMLILGAVGRWILPTVYHEVAKVGADDVFVLSTLVIALIAAWLTHSFHLSMALGAFVIGMMLGEGPFKHRIESEIRPFKDVLLGLFFVTIGMTVNVAVIDQYLLRIITFTIALIVINTIIVTLLVRIMGESQGAAVRVGITLAQAGEFGLALLVIAIANGVVPEEQASFIIAIAVLSMMLSPFLIRNSDALAELTIRWLPGGGRTSAGDLEEPITYDADHVIIGGFGRVGQTAAHLLANNDIHYIGIDNDPDAIRIARRAGNNVMYGDCTDTEMLEQCKIDRARLALLTFRSADMARETIEEIREKGIDTPIIARCYDNVDFEELISAGASHVIPEMLETSLVIGAQVLSFLDVEEQDVARQINELRAHQIDPYDL